MSQLEQVLFKIYTDSEYRQNVQNGIELLNELSNDERAAVKDLALSHWGDGGIITWTCDGR